MAESPVLSNSPGASVAVAGVPDSSDFLADVVAGLGAHPKTLPCKYFYDANGSHLFDQITGLEAYYPTRTEIGILRSHMAAIVKAIGPQAVVMEPGSGSSLKTRLLLEHLHEPVAYAPVDISREHLLEAAEALRRCFPHIPILPVVADYTQPFSLPNFPTLPRRVVAFYPGSTLGNFPPAEAIQFLGRLRALVGRDGGLLLGVDRKKDAAVLERAYNDPEGVTEAFHLNLLTRINRELGADFALNCFAHVAFYNDEQGRIEMHLRSTQAQKVHVGGRTFAFAPDETICTEYSYKYHPEEVAELGAAAGFSLEQTWSDPRDYFSVYWFVA